ncbi:MAG: single-stranded-DNA-specific exonuclease RecJ [SAR324 cluster bacterium]|nr:single-stranded-DNA-specific exonuclease RecJ [SAR324 cluster bacterium]
MPQWPDIQKWENHETAENLIQARSLSNEYKISSILARLLIVRNLTSKQLIWNFLEPHFKHCHDPFMMRDMDHAVQRLITALRLGEKVVIYGDYDVDGTVGTVLLYRFLQRLGVRVSYFIPKRLKDGYGLTEQTLMELKTRQARLIITVDNGARAVEEAAFLKRMGIDLLITDHHPPGEQMPEALAMVNPMRPDCPYPFKGLSGAGVAFKLLEALDHQLNVDGFWERTGKVRANLQQELDLVAFATISDSMPMTDENRYFIQKGLELMNPCRRPGFQALLRVCGVRGRVTSTEISFKLAPKINAAGRVDDPNLAVRLLLSQSLAEARPFADKMFALNQQRQKIEESVLNDALVQARQQMHQKALILIDQQWHPGVMGNIASRISRDFGKTTLALTFNSDSSSGSIHESIAVGSARSVGDLDLCNLLQECQQMLNRFGGHPAAVGLSLSEKNLDRFCQRFQQLLNHQSSRITPQKSSPPGGLVIDAWLNQDEFKPQLGQELLKLSPFGRGNPEPVLGVRNVLPHSAEVFGKKHLKFQFGSKDNTTEVVAWNGGNWFEWMGSQADLAISPTVYGRNVREQRIQYQAVGMKPHS